MSKVEDALKLFDEGFSCSQAICAVYGKQFGLERETAFKIAGAFGGGMGRMGETCGAVTGAFMVIGLKYGMTDVNDKDAKERTIEAVNEFVNKFNERNGSIVCKKLLGYDLSTPEGRKEVSEKGLTKKICPQFIKDAAEILEQILE
ncbi:MAG: C_GCAxxG_C_C family protein [Thermoplasmata archaeon]|nr:MAG: C_GCAxxG_C_C family protein [Thermoplasmata archaeon]